MAIESLFRVCFLIIFIPFILFWFWKFLMTGLTKASFYTVKEGFLSALIFRILQTASFIIVLIHIFSPALISWSYLSMPLFLRIPGILIGFISIILMISAFKALGKNYYASLNLRPDHVLVTSGIYSWIRHPLYIIFLLIWFSLFLLSDNLLIGVTSILSYIIIFLRRVPREEKMLMSQFTDDYIRYKQKTGKYFPTKEKLKTLCINRNKNISV